MEMSFNKATKSNYTRVRHKLINAACYKQTAIY